MSVPSGTNVSVSEPPPGLSPTERFVTGWTTTGVRLAKRAYQPVALAQLALTGLVASAALGVGWRFISDQTALDASTRLSLRVGHAIVLIAFGLLVLNAPFAVARIRLKAGVFGTLPVDGSIGPGEIASKVYSATWRLEVGCAITNVFAACVAMGLIYWIAFTGGERTTGSSPALLLVFPLALIALLALTLRQRHSQFQAAGGQLAPDAGPRPDGRIAHFLAAAPVTSGTATAAETIRCWMAPVMRVHSAGTPLLRAAGWAGPSGIQHDLLAQNTIVVTDQAVYVLCCLPPEQRALLASPTYEQAKVALFYSGTAIRQEAETQLQHGIAAVATSDPRNGRIPLSALTGLTLSGPELTITSTIGPPDSYIFNHAEAAVAFAQQAAGFGLPVRYVAARPSAAPVAMARAGRALGIVAGAVVGFLGVIFLLLALVGLSSGKVDSSFTGTAQGSVFSVIATPKNAADASGLPGCRAVGAFTVGAKTYQTDVGRLDAGSCAWSVGQPVTIRYDPTDPAHSVISSGLGSSRVVGWVFLFLGLGLVLFGAVLIFVPRLFKLAWKSRRS